jgi:hypothetical protein
MFAGTRLALTPFMDWLPAGTFDRGVVGGVTVAMGWFALVCLYRSLHYILEFGIWSWLTSALKIHRGSLGLILLLLGLLLAVVLCFPPTRP